MTGENQATAMFRLPSLSYNYFAPGNKVLFSFGTITNCNSSSFISPYVLLLWNTYMFSSILLMSSDTYNRPLSSYVLQRKKKRELCALLLYHLPDRLGCMYPCIIKVQQASLWQSFCRINKKKCLFRTQPTLLNDSSAVYKNLICLISRAIHHYIFSTTRLSWTRSEDTFKRMVFIQYFRKK